MSVSVTVNANSTANRGEYTDPGQILDGSVTVTSSAAATLLLTIPAGRTWVGGIALSVSATAATAGLYKATINTSGAGAVPASAVNILTAHMSLVGTTPAGLATFSDYIGDVVVSAPAANAVTLTVTNSTATAMTSDANAVGVLL